MSADTNAPVIIKRVKKIGGDGHHGGAWKVAYADFVTAMMAFFMLMWLLNATTEKQRKGIADYFSPTIPVHRVSGGGDGMGGGDSIFTEETLAQNGTGATSRAPSGDSQSDGGASTGNEADDDTERTAADARLQEILDDLSGTGGESLATENALRHIVTRVTDEGLIVEIFDLPGVPLFQDGTATATETLVEVSAIIERVFSLVNNHLAINGHIRSHPVVLVESPVWELSSARAAAMRVLLEEAGYAGTKIQRVTGFADRKTIAPDPMSDRNNRLELILLRSDR